MRSKQRYNRNFKTFLRKEVYILDTLISNVTIVT